MSYFFFQILHSLTLRDVAKRQKYMHFFFFFANLLRKQVNIFLPFDNDLNTFYKKMKAALSLEGHYPQYKKQVYSETNIFHLN